MVTRALDLGVTVVDTADLYGAGANEELVGAALRHRRDEAVLCTKFGVVRPADGMTTRGDAAYVRAACDAGLRRASSVHPIAALQAEWSLVARQVEELLPVCAELGTGVVPYCPQGAGRLSLLDPGVGRAHAPGAPPAARELPAAVDDIARAHDARPGQVALAWLRQQGVRWGVAVVPIPGTTKVAHLEENVVALEVELTAEELSRLDSASA